MLIKIVITVLCLCVTSQGYAGMIIQKFSASTLLLDVTFNNAITMNTGSGSVRFMRNQPIGYYDSNGYLQEAAIDTPVFDADTGYLILSGNAGSHVVNLDFSVPDAGDSTLPARWDVTTESGNATIARATSNPPGGVIQHYLDITSTSSGVALLTVPTAEVYENGHENGFYISAWLKADATPIWGKVRAINIAEDVIYWWDGSAWSSTEQYFQISDGTGVTDTTWTRVHSWIEVRPNDTDYTEIMGYRVPVTSAKPIKLAAVDYTAASLMPSLTPDSNGNPRNSADEYIKIQQSGNIDKTEGTIIIDFAFLEEDGVDGRLADGTFTMFKLDNTVVLIKDTNRNKWGISDHFDSAYTENPEANVIKEYGGSWSATDSKMHAFSNPGITIESNSFDGELGASGDDTDIVITIGNLRKVLIKRIRIYNYAFEL